MQKKYGAGTIKQCFRRHDPLFPGDVENLNDSIRYEIVKFITENIKNIAFYICTISLSE